MRIAHDGGTSEFLSESGSCFIDGVPHKFVAFVGNTLVVGHQGKLKSYRLKIPETALDYTTIFFGMDFYQLSGWLDGKEFVGTPSSRMSAGGKMCWDVTRGFMADGYVYTGHLTPTLWGREVSVEINDGEIIARGSVQVFPGQAEIQYFVLEPCATLKLRVDGGEWKVPEFHGSLLIVPPGKKFALIHRQKGVRYYAEFTTSQPSVRFDGARIY
jgi:hypothetical protein